MPGQLRFFVNEWAKITSDHYILQCVSTCPLEFYTEPFCLPRAVTRESKFSPEQQLTIDNEIKSFLAKGVAEPSVSEPNEVISPIFVRPKKDPKQFRVIFNLKALNQFVAYHKFKMETVESAVKLMSKCCYMSSMDLRDAYYSIPIAPEFRKYLKFIWREEMFQFTALPMGLSSRPRILLRYLR